MKAGWNLVGAIGYPIDSAAVRTQPAGILRSSFLEYLPGAGYVPTRSIAPGKAYWVRVSAAGKLILSVFAPSAEPGAADFEK